MSETGVIEKVENVLRPLGQRIIVRRLFERERSGILVPDAVRKTSLIGVVVHVGPDATDWVKTGDTILYAQYSPWAFPVDGKVVQNHYEDHLIMNAEDVLCVVEPSSKEENPT